MDDPRQSVRSLVRACSSALRRTCSSRLSPKLMMMFMRYPSHICKVRRNNITKAYFNRMKCNNDILYHMISERRDVNYRLRNVYPIPVTRIVRYQYYLVPRGLFN